MRRVFFGILCFILLYSPIVVRLFGLGGIYSNPFFRILEFSCGVLLSSFDVKEKFWKMFSWKWMIVPEVILLIGGVSAVVQRNFAVGDYMLYSWIALPLFTVMIITLSESWNMSGDAFVIKKVLPYLSKISYAFFLAQFFTWPLMHKIIDLVSDDNLFKILVSFVITLIFSILLHEAVEVYGKRFVLKMISRRKIHEADNA